MAALGFVIGSVACSGGDGAPDAPLSTPDAPRIDGGTGPCTDDEIHATVYAVNTQLAAVAKAGPAALFGAGLNADVHTGPLPRLVEPIASEGGCVLVSTRPTFCDPACDVNEVCTLDGECSAYSSRVSAGALQVTAGAASYDVPEVAAGTYYQSPPTPRSYAPGDQLTATFAGADVPAFSLTVTGAGDLFVPNTQLTATEHQPMVVTWQASAAGTGDEVVLHMDSDHHGTRAYVECTAPAEAGTLTVPATIIDALIEIGETGIGTYIENSEMWQRQRTLTRTANGCALFESQTNTFVSVETIRAK